MRFRNQRRAAVLDLQPLYLRSDAHVGVVSRLPDAKLDCMHLCGSRGGPLAVLPRLLLHMLQVRVWTECESGAGGAWWCERDASPESGVASAES